ncbi:MAG TPA: hypothetical protein PKH07_03920, partial [bacterium]|nr:hypothetical protein [bacterium]
PIPVGRFLCVKYFGGLVALLIIFSIPLLLETLTSNYGREREWYLWFSSYTANIAWTTPWLVLMVYSVAFLIGCVNRSTVTTALLSLGAGLLIVFAPLLLRPISFMSLFEWMVNPPIHLWPVAKHYLSTRSRYFFVLFEYGVYIEKGYVLFAICSLLISAAALFLSIVTVKKNITIDARQRTICWSLVAVVLLLSLGVSTELGTNMESDVVSLPEYCNFISSLHQFGDRTFALMQPGIINEHFQLAEIDVSGKATFSKRIWMPDRFWKEGDQSKPAVSQWIKRPVAWSPNQPNRVYTFIDHCEPEETLRYGREFFNYKRQRLELIALDLDRAREPLPDNRHEDIDPVLASIDMSAYLKISEDQGITTYNDASWPLFPEMSAYGNHLFILHRGRSVLLFDISGELGIPRFIAEQPADKIFTHMLSMGQGNEWILPAVEGLDDEDNLRLQIDLSPISAFSLWGDVLAEKRSNERDELVIHRLESLEERGFDQPKGTSASRARFSVAGVYPIPLLSRLLGSRSKHFELRDGLLFDVTKTVSDSLMVYDVRDPERIRRVGHYSVPNDQIRALLPLADGRTLLGGYKLHVVQPPKG